MYCQHCGEQIDDKAVLCPHCGTAVKEQTPSFAEKDYARFGFGVLGFFIPLAGFILFLCFEREKPLRARAAGRGALIGFILWVLFIIALIATAVLLPLWLIEAPELLA